MNNNYELLKGTKDVSSKEQIKINKILDTIRESFENFGFRPFDTPIIEYWDTLTMKYDKNDEIVQEIFKLSDRGKRKLGLRYDLTTPLSRFVASEKQLKKPFRRYQIGKVFRDGPIKPGRLREFIQCDGDVIGLSGVEIEAELMILFYQAYKQLGINAVIELNNNKILRGALLQGGFKEKDLDSLILSIDKMKKIGVEGVLKEIEEKKFNTQQAKESLEILNSNSFEEIEKLAQNEILKEGISELKGLLELLEGYAEVRVNFSMSRGLAIYTGNIWEAYDLDEKISSSLGAGGRYDKVIGEYSNSSEDIPAVGISFGLVPILACLESNEDKNGLSDVLVVPLEKELVPQCFKIAEKLRKDKLKVEMFYGYKLKKAFNYADYIGVTDMAIVGKKDIGNGFFMLKNLDSGVEKRVDL